ncbi:MAG: SGNH/GDSL hydrolase family protein [Mucilaginibacter sp.]
MCRRLLFLSLIILTNTAYSQVKAPILKLFKADNPNIQYFGRVDFSDPLNPRFWSPGVYIKLKFRGTAFDLIVNDESSGDNHNYIEIAIDDNPLLRIKLDSKLNDRKIAYGLTNTEHIVTICKDTESGIGYMNFVGVRCEELLPPRAKPIRKIEYIGDSITAGTGMDISEIPCDRGQWYDQHNAYMSYGPRTSRALDAQWQLTAVAGIGLTHSCCNMDIVMPDVLDKMLLRDNKIQWDFTRYQPDVVTICLGQNDGIVDSAFFCNAYVRFIDTVRKYYPKADIICLNSPMANDELTPVLKRYLSGITAYENQQGDKKVYKYFFSKRYHNGCGGHPDLNEHENISDELTAYIRQVESW